MLSSDFQEKKWLVAGRSWNYNSGKMDHTIWVPHHNEEGGVGWVLPQVVTPNGDSVGIRGECPSGAELLEAGEQLLNPGG